jgi:hypothetical protein
MIACVTGAIAVPVLALLFWAIVATMKYRDKKAENADTEESLLMAVENTAHYREQVPMWHWNLDPSLNDDRIKRRWFGNGDPIDHMPPDEGSSPSDWDYSDSDYLWRPVQAHEVEYGDD